MLHGKTNYMISSAFRHMNLAVCLYPDTISSQWLQSSPQQQHEEIFKVQHPTSL